MVKFSLVDSNGNNLPSNIENGQISGLSGPVNSNPASSTTVTTTATSYGNKAFALFTGPSQFVRCSTPGLITCIESGTLNAQDAAAFQRQEYIDVQFTPTGEPTIDFGPAAVNLIRPMVFLVHGIWADQSTWDNFQLNPATATGLFYIQRANYKATNDKRFAVNAPIVYEQLTEYLNQFKIDKSVAAIQADVVVHSMGAPIVRTMALPATLQGQYLNDPNFPTFGVGPIRKLITIAGVHTGSPWANNVSGTSYPAGTPQIPFGLLDAFLLASAHNPYNGAVADMSVMSDALQLINAPGVQTPFPVHTIVGVADASAVESVQADLNNFGGGFLGLGWANLSLPSILQGDSDVIVPTTSQAGFSTPLPGASVSSVVNHIVHTSGLDLLASPDVSELESPGVYVLVRNLIDINALDGGYWHTLPK